MLDIKFIRENPQLVAKSAADKNFSVDVDKLLELDKSIRPLKQAQEELQAKRNLLSKKIPKAEASEREELKAEVINIKKEIDRLQTELIPLSESLHKLMLHVPQPARDDVPVGKSEENNVELRTWGKLPEFDFKIRDHIELGEKLGGIDFPGGVKLAGSRSYVLKGKIALLERALLQYAYDSLVKKNFTPLSVPVLVEEKIMEGTGYFPIGRDQAYFIEKDKLALIGTSEVSLCGLYSKETIKEELPLRLIAQSTCFRREAGTYGKDTRGLYRVHQFQKIEMVIIAPADKELSETLHDELLQHSEQLLQDLKLPYRVVYVCSGDLGQGQVRKHDLEAWMPSRDSYGETHSCSTFYDFQARRLNIRYKDKEGNKKLAYTLNNTLCASPRLLIPIIENYQTKDGRIEIPECLRSYMGGITHID